MHARIRQPESGFTLIEMMVSIGLGILIILGVGQIFVATRTSYSAQQGLSSVQQSGRFAMTFVGGAVRSAGDMGFSNSSSLMRAADSVGPEFSSEFGVYQLSNFTAAGPTNRPLLEVAAGLQVYEYTGSNPGQVLALVEPPALGTANEWSPPLPAVLVGRAVRGSDVIVTRYMDGLNFALESKSNAGYEAAESSAFHAYCTTSGIDIGKSGNINSGVTGAAFVALVNAADSRMYGVACPDASYIFQASNIGTATDPRLVSYGGVGFPGNITDASGELDCGAFATNPPVGGVCRVGEINIEAYYIGRNASTNEPGLWRLRFNGTATETFVAEELVEGIENMQLAVGLTMPNATGISSSRTDRFVSANQLNDPVGSLGLTGESTIDSMRRIMGMRLALLARSEQGAAGQVNNLTYQLARTTVDPVDDRRIRQVYEQTLGVRNRNRLFPAARNGY